MLHSTQDDSVDTSYTKIQDEEDLTEPHFVKNVFGDIGTDTQGPAGARVPDEGYNGAAKGLVQPMFLENDQGVRQKVQGGNHSMTGQLESFTVTELCGSDEISAAASASAAIHARHSDTESMLMAMEQAEAAYGEAHKDVNSQLGQRRPQVANQPSQRMRNHVVEKLEEAMRGNPQLGPGDDAQIPLTAQQIEQSLYELSESRELYQGIASNAVRIASKASSVDEILRVARKGSSGLDSNQDEVMLDLSGMPEIAVKYLTDM